MIRSFGDVCAAAIPQVSKSKSKLVVCSFFVKPARRVCSLRIAGEGSIDGRIADAEMRDGVSQKAESRNPKASSKVQVCGEEKTQ